MKKLTQEVFKDAPHWVKSAAVHKNGRAGYFDSPRCMLDTEANTWGYAKWFQSSVSFGYQTIGKGFDATDWQNSVIDREVQP